MARIKIECTSGVGDTLVVNAEHHENYEDRFGRLWFEIEPKLSTSGGSVGLDKAAALQLSMALATWAESGELPKVRIKVPK